MSVIEQVDRSSNEVPELGAGLDASDPPAQGDSTVIQDLTPAPGFFRPRVSWTIIGLASVCLSCAVAILAGGRIRRNSDGRRGHVVSGGGVAQWAAWIRWDQAASFYDFQRGESTKWNSRWRALRGQSQQTAIVLSHLTDGVILVSSDAEILLINPAARSLLGLSHDDVFLGRRFSELVRIPELIQLVKDATLRPSDEEEPETKRIALEVVTGTSVRPVSVRADRISQKPDSNVTLVIRDETEAQRVEAIRREFIANVSHELKTPLAAIKGYAETVEIAIEDDAEAAKHFVGQITGQCQRLELLVADMMQLARAQSGDEKLNIGMVNLDDVISQSLVTFRPIADAKGVDLEVELSGGKARVISDPEATLTIAHNLISNAIRHTSAGGKVRVFCQPEDEYWALVVKDNGEGIDLADQERVFERFYRVSKMRNPGMRGRALGSRLSRISHARSVEMFG